MPRVSIAKGTGLVDTTRRCLDAISDEIQAAVASRRVVIKPNFVSSTIALASSHVEQMRGILEHFAGYYSGKFIIAEASAENTLEAFENFGYHALVKEYGVRLVDLNVGPFEKLIIRDRAGKELPVGVASLLLDRENFVVSAARLKTHDTVVVALSIKNLVMGGIRRADKKLMHQGFRQINLNIADLAMRLWPSLSVIDGIKGMEGEGPIRGSPVDSGIVISSIDPLAADRVACEAMGVDFSKVGYLRYCAERGLGEADLQGIEVVGEKLPDCVRPFRLHSTVEKQYAWG